VAGSESCSARREPNKGLKYRYRAYDCSASFRSTTDKMSGISRSSQVRRIPVVLQLPWLNVYILIDAMYGVPYNTSNKEVKSREFRKFTLVLHNDLLEAVEWSSFTAAAMGDAFESTRDLLMKTIRNYALNPDTGFLQSTYSLDSGNPSRATGAVGVEQGSMFALQALQ